MPGEMQDTHANGLSIEEVRRVAHLSRLSLDDGALEQSRTQLSAVLRHMEMLSALDLTDVQPMAHPSDAVNRWDDDVPGQALPTSALMKMAPQSAPPFIKVPKVFGDGSGA